MPVHTYDRTLLRRNDQPIALRLGDDATTEHEIGINPLGSAFGMSRYDPRRYGPRKAWPDRLIEKLESRGMLERAMAALRGKDLTLHEDEIGLPARTATQIPSEGVALVDLGDSLGLWVVPGIEAPPAGAPFWERETRRSALFSKEKEYPGIEAAWSDRGFAVRAFSAEARALVEDLYAGILAKDFSVFFGGRDYSLAANGLIACRTSNVPKQDAQKMAELDEDGVRLKLAARATGIEAYLREQGMEWFALSPRWADDEKTEVRFWLNPQDQQENNYGMYTVDELRAWPQGEGPIPIRKQARSRRG